MVVRAITVQSSTVAVISMGGAAAGGDKRRPLIGRYVWLLAWAASANSARLRER
jgi:hypothetical protein